MFMRASIYRTLSIQPFRSIKSLPFSVEINESRKTRNEKRKILTLLLARPAAGSSCLFRGALISDIYKGVRTIRTLVEFLIKILLKFHMNEDRVQDDGGMIVGESPRILSIKRKEKTNVEKEIRPIPRGAFNPDFIRASFSRSAPSVLARGA